MSPPRRAPAFLGVIFFTGCGMWSAAGPGCGVTEDARPFPEALRESSGVAPSLVQPGVFWTHSDNPGGLLWRVDARGDVLAQVQLEGVRVFDPEDIAAAKCGDDDCLYLADTGDNYDERDSLAVYRVPEPAGGVQVIAPQRFPLRLPDGPRDIEAMFLLPDEQLFLVTKGREKPVTVYRYPGPLRADTMVTMEHVQELSENPRALPRQVTGASASQDGSVIVIRTYETLLFYRWDGARLVPLENGTVNLRSLRESQGEGVGIGADGLVVLTSEGGPSGGPGSITVMRCRI